MNLLSTVEQTKFSHTFSHMDRTVLDQYSSALEDQARAMVYSGKEESREI